jgi:hypothetical protein
MGTDQELRVNQSYSGYWIDINMNLAYFAVSLRWRRQAILLLLLTAQASSTGAGNNNKSFVGVERSKQKHFTFAFLYHRDHFGGKSFE